MHALPAMISIMSQSKISAKVHPSGPLATSGLYQTGASPTWGFLHLPLPAHHLRTSLCDVPFRGRFVCRRGYVNSAAGRCLPGQSRHARDDRLRRGYHEGQLE